MTARFTATGSEFEEIPDVCTVYICKFDIFKHTKAVYHVDRTLREGGERLYNGHTEIYVNATARDNTRASELMKLFVEPDAYNYNDFPEVSGLKYQCLHTQEGRKRMDAILESYIEDIEAAARADGEKRGLAEGERRGLAEGERRGRILSAVDLFKNGFFDLAEASRWVKMSEEEFKTFMDKLEQETK